MNAHMWVRQGKTQPALANISAGGEGPSRLVLSGLGLMFTPWLFDGPLLMAGIAPIASGRVSAGYVVQTPDRRTPRVDWRVLYGAFAVALDVIRSGPARLGRS